MCVWTYVCVDKSELMYVCVDVCVCVWIKSSWLSSPGSGIQKCFD